ncbi:MAG: ABC transporter permease [Desulfobacterales bacterium]|nr:ABC transporter permease [Desulfobacterales bacterium]
MINRLKQMLIKEFLQILRDPRMRMVVLGIPVIQMLVMSFAMTMDVTHISTAVMDMDKTQSSRELINAFGSNHYFQIHYYINDQNAFSILLDSKKVGAILHIPSGFESDINAGRTAKVQLIADGTDSNTTAILLGYADGIVNGYSSEKLMMQLKKKYGAHYQPVQVETITRAWFNPNQESKYFYVPSLIAVMLFIFSLLLTSIGIVKEKEMGTIEQIMVTPIRKMEFIIAKTIPCMTTGYLTMTLMIGVAILVFNVHIQGSMLLLYFLTSIYLIGNMGIALIISASAVTQQQALLTAFLIIMPCVMLSGFIFPIHNMPQVVQYATYFNPMRWYLEILRGIVMKGAAMKSLWVATLWQSFLAVLFITLATKRFKKTLS